jgi:hypothetical protein
LANNVGVVSLMMANNQALKNENFFFPEVDEGPLQPQVIKSLEPILQPLHGGYQPTILMFWRD